jgi:hypothetical protein
VNVLETQRTTLIRKENLMNKLFRIFLFAAFAPLIGVACGQQGLHQPAAQLLSVSPTLEPGDQIDGMIVTTGAVDAAPLWAYCSPLQENTHIRTFQCRAPVWQTLAIGHLFLLADQALLNRGGTELVWELAIDDQVVDLESFGTFDYVMPAMPASPSPVREVFARVTDWNLVMTNLNPGEHILHFRAQNDAAQYHWLVYLVIEPTDGIDVSAAPFPLHS